MDGGRMRLCLADHHAAVAFQPIGRDDQIGGRRSAAKNPAGKIVFRRMARTEELAANAKSRTQLRRTPLMRALADGDEYIRPQRAMPVAASFRLQGVRGIRIGQFAFAVGQRGDFLGAASQNPDRATVPVHGAQFAERQITEIDRCRIS